MEDHGKSELNREINPFNSQKRAKYGSLNDANKKMKLQTHETGNDCKFKKHCFNKVSDDNRKKIL